MARPANTRAIGAPACIRRGHLQGCMAAEPMTTLLIDNHDSNTFNLFQLLAVVEGAEPVVVRNDETDWASLRAERFTRCVISAGPGRPDRPRDFGLSLGALAEAELPVLGVCLGLQGLVLAHGGEVDAAPRPMHGRRSRIYHEDPELFRGIPQGFLAVRYHSLSAREPLPAALEATARTASGTVMAVRHCERPHWGVQFHPESVETQFGERLLENFVGWRRSRARRRPPRHRPPGRLARALRPPPASRPRRRPRARGGSVRRPPDPETAFIGLFGSEPNAFWLDSSRAGGGDGRFSFMGAGGGPLSARSLSHDVAAAELTLARRGQREVHRSGLFDWLDRSLARFSVADPVAPVRLHRRVRRLPRVRAQGRVRLCARAPLPPPRRDAAVRRPPDRLRPGRGRSPRHLPDGARGTAATASAWAEQTARAAAGAARRRAAGAGRPGRAHDLFAAPAGR